MRATFHHEGRVSEVSDANWALIIRSLAFDAIIFDCDGTLVDSTEAHFLSMRAAAIAQGQVMTKEWYKSLTGLDRRSLFVRFAEFKGGHFDIAKACQDSIAAYSDCVSFVTPIKTSVDLLRDLHGEMPIAVASNAEREVVNLSLAKTGVAGLISAIATISDGTAPKPAPDLFLLAAKRLGIQAARALVIEDSAEGTQAALAAGMSVMRIIEP
ncbi:beta-phosphoglucomutase-like phosphatase (HAD superfamily) [Rubricella aquisinus]|uniref:phosphoglycolate phosphatase n=1 Tax=Rubricella aquisinus TaxID=2028108 RepID=A0A840WJW3_9RHOB|nr:HAD family phosphatase [Rubricella aquisinus]MBB5515359.1 beta-phosphoglucomutase-like phosphatase (HAD superfamily) [Rubricella aquisinus]